MVQLYQHCFQCEDITQMLFQTEYQEIIIHDCNGRFLFCGHILHDTFCNNHIVTFSKFWKDPLPCNFWLAELLIPLLYT